MSLENNTNKFVLKKTVMTFWMNEKRENKLELNCFFFNSVSRGNVHCVFIRNPISVPAQRPDPGLVQIRLGKRFCSPKMRRYFNITSMHEQHYIFSITSCNIQCT